MTTEERVFIQVSDIRALEFTCKNCGAKTTRSPHAEKQFLPFQCANCNQEFLAPQMTLEKALRNFYNAVRDIRRLESEANFDLRLEIESESEEKTKEGKS